MDISYELKLVYSNISSAMVKNLNADIISVSFALVPNKNIQLKFVLLNETDIVLRLIDDIVAETSALSESNNILSPIITKIKEPKMQHLVYESIGV